MQLNTTKCSSKVGFTKKKVIQGRKEGRLASVGIIGIEREPEIGKLGWHKKFDTGIKRNISF